MMKRRLSLLVTTALTAGLHAQWSPSYHPNNTEPMYAIESHGGDLFASSNMEGFIRSTDDGMSWASVGQTGFTTSFIGTRVSHIRSVGDDLLVVTFNPSFASSMIYRSTDGGNTFTPDTVGLPKVSGNNECVNIDRIEQHNGWVVVDVANLGNWWLVPGSGAWQKNNDPGTTWSENFTFHNGTAYTWGTSNLYTATDPLGAWTQVASNGVPPWFTAQMLTCDASSGRLFVVGQSATTQEYALLHSDNAGVDWSDIALEPIQGNNWLGSPQTITALYASNGLLEIAMQNEAGTSPPNVFASTNASTFTADHEGLLTDAGQFQHGIGFVAHASKLFMAMSAPGIWMKDLATGVPDVVAGATDLIAYPSPALDRVRVLHDSRVVAARAWDASGRMVEVPVAIDGTLDLSTFSPGVWQMELHFVDGTDGHTRVMKD